MRSCSSGETTDVTSFFEFKIQNLEFKIVFERPFRSDTKHSFNDILAAIGCYNSCIVPLLSVGDHDIFAKVSNREFVNSIRIDSVLQPRNVIGALPDIFRALSAQA